MQIFSKMNIAKKLIFFSGVMVLIIGMLGFISFQKTSQILNQLDNVAGTQLPAVRAMTLADMMHDGIRAVIFASLDASNNKNVEELKLLQAELVEKCNDFNKYIGDLDHLHLKPQTAEALNQSKPELKEYIDMSQNLMNVFVTSDYATAKAQIPEFNKSFTKLEEKLEVLGELIEADASSVQSEGKDVVIVVATIAIFGILFALVCAYLIIRNLVQSLRSVTEQLVSTGESLGAISNQVQTAGSGLSEGVISADRSLQTAASTLTQLNQMIRTNSDNAQMSSSLAGQAQQNVEKGMQVVMHLVSSMSEISSNNSKINAQIEMSNQRIKEIVGVIESIGEKTKVINDIVFQTKLLSFNASVEAARAGEHGKGFSVVAEEVGKLAQMSGSASQEISTMLTESSQKVSQIVHETESQVTGLIAQAKNSLDSGVKIVDQCKVLFTEMSKAIDLSFSKSGEIAQATKEQEKGLSDITDAVQVLNKVMKENSSACDATSEAVHGLSDQLSHLYVASGSLKQIVDGQPRAS